MQMLELLRRKEEGEREKEGLHRITARSGNR